MNRGGRPTCRPPRDGLHSLDIDSVVKDRRTIPDIPPPHRLRSPSPHFLAAQPSTLPSLARRKAHQQAPTPHRSHRPIPQAGRATPHKRPVAAFGLLPLSLGAPAQLSCSLSRNSIAAQPEGGLSCPEASGAQHIDRGGGRGFGGTIMMDGGKLSGRKGPSRRRGITEEDYYRLHPKLVGLFRRRGVPPEDARELAQDTLLQAYKNLASFEDRAAFDTWVLSIAKNRWLHHRRDKARMKRSAEEIPLDVAASSGHVPTVNGHEARVIARDLLSRVRQSMRRLPEAMRQALLLHADGHKYREIASLLGVNVNQVSSLIHQARAKLRREAR